MEENAYYLHYVATCLIYLYTHNDKQDLKLSSVGIEDL